MVDGGRTKDEERGRGRDRGVVVHGWSSLKCSMSSSVGASKKPCPNHSSHPLFPFWRTHRPANSRSVSHQTIYHAARAHQRLLSNLKPPHASKTLMTRHRTQRGSGPSIPLTTATG